MAGVLGPRIGAAASGAFLRWTNMMYATPAAMARSAAVATAGVPEEEFFWGHYQKRVFPDGAAWPKFTLKGARVDSFQVWDADVRTVREALRGQPNNQPVTPVDRGDVPANRCDLLDRAVRRAFYATPPIPKAVDAGQAAGAEHELELGWSQNARGDLVRLHILIRCPAPAKSGARRSGA